MPDSIAQTENNEQERQIAQLNLLGWALFVLAAIGLVFAFFWGGFLALFLTLYERADVPQDRAIVRYLPYFITAVHGLSLVGLAAISAMEFYAAWCLWKRRHYIYVMVMTGLSAVGFPIGTIIGVLGIVLLFQPGVRQLFDEGESVEAKSDV
jgi:hypothetical protein